MLALVLALTALAPAAAQLFPTCPNYQSTTNFTKTYVNQMRAEVGGYIIRLSSGDQMPCQRLQFVDGNDFNYSFIDLAGEFRHSTDRYAISLRSTVAPAKLELTLPERMLGATDALELVPLVALPDVLVLASCSTFGVSINQQVLVLSPFTKQNTTSNYDIMTILNKNGVPNTAQLQNVSTNCVPVPPANTTSLALEIYRVFMNRFRMPLSAVQNAMLRDDLANRNTPQEVADQVFRIFDSMGISPQIIAARSEIGQQSNQLLQNNLVNTENVLNEVVPATAEQRSAAAASPPAQAGAATPQSAQGVVYATQPAPAGAVGQPGLVYATQPATQLVQSLPATNYFRALAPGFFMAPQGFTSAQERSDSVSSQVFIQPASRHDQIYYKF